MSTTFKHVNAQLCTCRRHVLSGGRYSVQVAAGNTLPTTAAGTSAVVMAALRDAYPAEVMNLASNLDMKVRPLCLSVSDSTVGKPGCATQDAVGAQPKVLSHRSGTAS